VGIFNHFKRRAPVIEWSIDPAPFILTRYDNPEPGFAARLEGLNDTDRATYDGIMHNAVFNRPFERRYELCDISNSYAEQRDGAPMLGGNLMLVDFPKDSTIDEMMHAEDLFWDDETCDRTWPHYKLEKTSLPCGPGYHLQYHEYYGDADLYGPYMYTAQWTIWITDPREHHFAVVLSLHAWGNDWNDNFNQNELETIFLNTLPTYHHIANTLTIKLTEPSHLAFGRS
jgi:hypothetical protein